MQDLKDLTHDLHYENFRTKLIESQNLPNTDLPRGRLLTSDETDKLLQQKDLEVN